MADELEARERGDRLARQVILGRTEPSGDEHHVRPRGSEPERSDDALDVVTDRLSEQHVDADPREPLRHPPGVRIGDLPEQELGPDREDLGPYHDGLTATASRRGLGRGAGWHEGLRPWAAGRPWDAERPTVDNDADRPPIARGDGQVLHRAVRD